MNLNLVLSLLAFCGVVTGSKPASTSKIQLAIENVKFAVYDKWISTPNISTIKINTKESRVPVVDKGKKMLAKFTIKDAAKNAAIAVQQAFVALVHKDSEREVVFVAEPDAATKEYSVDVDFKAQESSFDGLNGTYGVRLIVGDSNAANAFDWNFADIKATFAPVVRPVAKKSQLVNYETLPEIVHKFREPEVRPPQVISDTFTLICLAPLLLLVVLWLRIGFNFGNIQFSLWALGFHAGLISIFGLYFTFWLRLNMFETLKYLTFIGVPTFICGNRLLRSLNYYRTQTKSE